jgi:hypothetical protein
MMAIIGRFTPLLSVIFTLVVQREINRTMFAIVGNVGQSTARGTCCSGLIAWKYIPVQVTSVMEIRGPSD